MEKCSFWDVNDCHGECLSMEDPDDAISEYLNRCRDLPKTVELTGWARDKITDLHQFEGAALDALLEVIDERYGDQDEATKPTTKLLKAEHAFIKAVVDGYHVWSCHEVSRSTVDVGAWCREHEPELLKVRP